MTRVSVLIDTGTATCRALATQLHARHLPYLSIQVTDHDRSVRQDNASPVYLHVKPFRPPFLPPTHFPTVCRHLRFHFAQVRLQILEGLEIETSPFDGRIHNRGGVLSLRFFSLDFPSSFAFSPSFVRSMRV